MRHTDNLLSHFFFKINIASLYQGKRISCVHPIPLWHITTGHQKRRTGLLVTVRPLLKPGEAYFLHSRARVDTGSRLCEVLQHGLYCVVRDSATQQRGKRNDDVHLPAPALLPPQYCQKSHSFSGKVSE